MFKRTIELFQNPIQNQKQVFIIVISSLLFIFMPQLPPSDWKLNTLGLFENFLGVYQNPNYVYPPWALIPLCGYRLIGPEGARILSVISIGLLCKQKQWSLFKFFTIILSPFFLATMTKSNIDILCYVLPVVLWEKFEQKSRFQFVIQLIAIYLLFIKPQGALLVVPFLFLIHKVSLKRILLLGFGLLILAIPVSFLSNPPLIIQWLNNVLSPSPQNRFYWSINNISFTSKSYAPYGMLIVVSLGVLIFGLVKKNVIRWSTNHWISSLLYLSMIVSPYTSQQSFSSALAYIPSFVSFVYQIIIILFFSFTEFYFDYLAFVILSIFVVSLTTYNNHKEVK